MARSHGLDSLIRPTTSCGPVWAHSYVTSGPLSGICHTSRAYELSGALGPTTLNQPGQSLDQLEYSFAHRSASWPAGQSRVQAAGTGRKRKAKISAWSAAKTWPAQPSGDNGPTNHSLVWRRCDHRLRGDSRDKNWKRWGR